SLEGVMESLAKHRVLGEAPAQEHRWLAEHGEVRRFEVDAVVTQKGQLAPAMLIVFSGHLVIRVDRGVGAHKIIEWQAGDVGGTMPYSRGAVPPGDVVAEDTSRLLVVAKELFPTMIRECPTITTKLVHLMLDRARQFNANDLRDEKLLSLGKLSAGLAHELNNPAAAVIRSARSLNESIGEAARTTRQLGSLRLAEPQLDAMARLRDLCMSRPAAAARSPIDRADHEDAIGDWLSAHGADQAHALALAETPLTIADLDDFARQLDGEALNVSLHWLAADCMMRTFANDIEDAATRICDLVDTVKSFSYMDRALTTESVDVGKGITDTLRLLEAKRREKSIIVLVDVAHDLPRVLAVGGELNQVWMHLIENAMDAVAHGGNVMVAAVHEGAHVVVKVVDDGPGIPAEDQDRIYEPFFTTKGVDKGIGLGLYMVKRILHRHEGGVDLDSQPGMTEFLVRLPVRTG
ncbi:MAG TPA: ATP-binding protein, partial [Trueperaceae bacterium]|nr:ATP-binding protein [Trueperaceae bacterium]